MKLFVGAKAVVVNQEDNILIVRESGSYEEGTNEGRWDVPGGRIEPEESFFDGLKREVKEEAGLDVEPGTIVRVAENFIEIKNEPCHIIRIYVVCTFKDSKEVALSDDHDAYEWIKPEEHEAYQLISAKTDSLHDVFVDYLALKERGIV